MRWLCAKLDGETVAVALDGIPSGGVIVRAPLRRPARSRSPSAASYAGRLRAAGVEPDAAERRRAIVEALDAIGGWSDPGGVLEEVVYLVESPIVLDGSLRRAVPRASPSGSSSTAMQSHQRYFPLGGARFAFVANGGEPDARPGRQRAGARGPARGRVLHLRA